MRKIVRSLTMVAVALVLTAGFATAQCNPKAGCTPKAGGCTPKAGGCTPKAGAMSGPAKHVTLTGVVSDATCGRKHTMMPGKSDAECTRACIMKGSKYALVVGDKVYTLEGQSDALDKLAGETAKIHGMASGDTVQVASVQPAKGKKS